MPGTTGLEVGMSNPFRNTILVAAVLLAVLVAAPACQCDSVEPKMRKEHIVEIGPPEPGSKYKWGTIEDIDISSGDTVRIIPNEYKVWILIPDNRFKLVSGGSDWVISKTFTAFKAMDEDAVIELDAYFPEDKPKETIHYSILVHRGKDPSDGWDYVHGNNPPPRMIVPPH
jgi:hypothetical protein